MINNIAQTKEIKARTPRHRRAGFTLIETVVYLGLFAILFSGGIAAAYNVLETSGKNQSKAMIQEEGDFLIAKINWALSGDQAINQPAVGTASSFLSVNKVTGLDAVNNLPVITPVTLMVSNGDLLIGYPDGKPGDSSHTPVSQPLNNSSIDISGLEFIHQLSTGNNMNPESVNASFSIETRTSNGADYRQDFETTVYLRR